MTDIAAIVEDRRSRARAWFESLRDRIFAALGGDRGRCARRPLSRPARPIRASALDARDRDRRRGRRLPGRPGVRKGRGAHLLGQRRASPRRWPPPCPAATRTRDYVSTSISLIVHPALAAGAGGAHEHPLPVDRRELVRRRRRPDPAAGRAAPPGRAGRGRVPRGDASAPATPTTRTGTPSTRPGATSTSSCRTATSRAGSAASSTTGTIPATSSATSPSPATWARPSWRSIRRSSAGRMAEPWTRGRARGAAGPPRPLRRVQPALRPRHHVRSEDRRQHRDHPVAPCRPWCAGRRGPRYKARVGAISVRHMWAEALLS